MRFHFFLVASEDYGYNLHPSDSIFPRNILFGMPKSLKKLFGAQCENKHNFW